MPVHKIVVHYTDGTIVKGHTSNFSPNGPSFVIIPSGAEPAAEPITVEMGDLKAVFFVRDFEGEPDREDRDFFVSNQPYQGRRVQVTFKDGETLVGATPSYSREMKGFFVFPADTESNTLKVFAIASSVQTVRFEEAASTRRR